MWKAFTYTIRTIGAEKIGKGITFVLVLLPVARLLYGIALPSQNDGLHAAERYSGGFLQPKSTKSTSSTYFEVAGTGKFCGGQNHELHRGNDDETICQQKCNGNPLCVAYATFVNSHCDSCITFSTCDSLNPTSCQGTITAYRKRSGNGQLSSAELAQVVPEESPAVPTISLPEPAVPGAIPWDQLRPITKLTDHALQSPIKQLTKTPGYHYFGYFDKSPWSMDQKFLLAGHVSFYNHDMSVKDRMDIGVIDLASGEWQKLTSTGAFNFQQGSMLNWVGPGRFIFNDRDEGDTDLLISRVFGMTEPGGPKEVRRYSRPVYAVDPNGKWATSLNFLRLHVIRLGYGYPGSQKALDAASNPRVPANDGLFVLNLETGESKLALSIKQMFDIQVKTNQGLATKSGCWHWFNHAQLSRDASRIVVLYRFKCTPGPGHGGSFTTIGLFTVNRDGTDLWKVPHVAGSHHDFWGSGGRLISCDHISYVVAQDQVAVAPREAKVIVKTEDGHCSFNPSSDRWAVSDTYPKDCKPEHKATCGPGQKGKLLFVLDLLLGTRHIIGQFQALGEGPEHTRSDLHPRWSRDGSTICFDSTHIPGQGRQLFTVDVSSVVGVSTDTKQQEIFN